MTNTQSTQPTNRHAFGDVHIDAADLREGDIIHHWSSRGGTWTVKAADLELSPYITLRSDLGATRHMTAEQIDTKGAWLKSRAEVPAEVKAPAGRIQPAVLEHSTGRAVQGWADRAQYDAGDMYVDVQFDATSRPTKVHRSKVLAFAALSSGWVTTEREHENCAGCERAAENARIMAKVTGSKGAESIDDGRLLAKPYYHRAVVKRA